MKNATTALFRRLGKSRSPKAASFIEVERAERLFYLKYVHEGMTILDVGAGIGELTLMFSRFVGATGQVHAFEPSSESFKRLTATCSAASLRNTQLHQRALTNEEGTIILHCYGDDYLNWTSQAERPLHRYGINVNSESTEKAPATTLDIFCKTNSVSSIDLLKIDVEGAEFQVLLGARRMLKAQAVKCIAFEFGQTTFDMGNDPNEIETYLDNLGYLLRNLVSDDPIFPGRESAESACFSMHVASPKSSKLA
ncbi:MAG: FkbM family methyltransferase [Acidobacteriota bacterium]